MRLKKILIICLIFPLLVTVGYASDELISLFPLGNYNQEVSNWIKPSDENFNKVLMSEETQRKHLDLFYNHYIGSLSPWNEKYVNHLLKRAAPDDIKAIERSIIADFSNEGKSDDEIGYGENFRPYRTAWIEQIKENINLAQFENLSYRPSNRGIAIDNLHARALPTEDVHFFSYKLAGQGYPFDNLQMSALWAGTPVYIIGETRDHAWMLVITPEYIAWVKTNGIARVNEDFVDTWTSAAKTKLAAITKTQTSIVDQEGIFRFTSYVGAVFPATKVANGLQLMIPVADTNHTAMIKYATVSSDSSAMMPLSPTPRHFSMLMNTLINRVYGWGGMYFYNDCSAEMKSILTPFGIWLPRHSSSQVKIGKMVDMSTSSKENRLSYLMNNGERFLTLVYIGGHVLLYIGNYDNPNKPSSKMAMTYQDMWGLYPRPSTRRAVIGKSVLFPMLLQFPEDPTLISQADKKYFQVSYLTQLPSTGVLLNVKLIDLRSLMWPSEQ